MKNRVDCNIKSCPYHATFQNKCALNDPDEPADCYGDKKCGKHSDADNYSDWKHPFMYVLLALISAIIYFIHKSF